MHLRRGQTEANTAERTFKRVRTRELERYRERYTVRNRDRKKHKTGRRDIYTPYRLLYEKK